MSGLTSFLLWIDGNDLKIALFVTALFCSAAVALVATEVWRTHGEHVEAKKKGRKSFYAEYKLQICQVIRESSFQAEKETQEAR